MLSSAFGETYSDFQIELNEYVVQRIAIFLNECVSVNAGYTLQR